LEEGKGLKVDLGSMVIISACVFFVAALYSSVGHGGASGYLAVLSFFAVAPATMASTALTLNVLVAGVAMYSYIRAGHLSMRLAWPFIILSIPAAFVGGALRVSDKIYFALLAIALVFAAFRLALTAASSKEEGETHAVKLSQSLPVGAGIGLLSGVVGVGGGIFLSPLMILFRWANAKRTSAVSALFIVVNSLAGLAGRLMKGGLDIGGFGPLVVVAFLGGLIGSHYGANRFSGVVLRRLLALVLVIASIKMVVALV
jgi:uncharacterized membrane protein YfcA